MSVAVDVAVGAVLQDLRQSSNLRSVGRPVPEREYVVGRHTVDHLSRPVVESIIHIGTPPSRRDRGYEYVFPPMVMLYSRLALNMLRDALRAES
jgi:hypothetical protein